MASQESWRNVAILSAAQALAASAGPFVVLSGGIVGQALAPSPLLATLPITALVVGLACAAVPVAALIRRIGRRSAFVLGAAVSSAAALVAARAVTVDGFAMFCAATFVMGGASACVQQYRFAAADSVDARHTGRAVSWVLVGGIIAGALGPEIARRGRLWFGTEFSGAFVIVAIIQLVAMAVLAGLRIPPAAATANRGEHLTVGALFAERSFVLAVAAAGSASATMSFLMTATPISMHVHDSLSIDDAAFVIQSHVVAMYAPSLVTGWLVDRLGVARMMAAGAVVIGGAIAAATTGHSVTAYWLGLVLLGLGWNLLFIGATVLLTQSFALPERIRAQGLNDLIVFSSQAVASLAAGAVLHRFGWLTMNLMAVPLLVLVLVLVAKRGLGTPK
ncbi:MAG TPA: MFS transporter [Vicinamibacterales bacterium]|nr:MFS transporter [Vicinamibacterales bacterium]